MIGITRWIFRLRRPLLIVGFAIGVTGAVLVFTSGIGLGLLVVAVGSWLAVPAFMTVWPATRAAWLGEESSPGQSDESN